MKLTNVRVREQLKVFILSIECSRTYLFMQLGLKGDTDSKMVVLLDAYPLFYFYFCVAGDIFRIMMISGHFAACYTSMFNFSVLRV